MQTRSQPANDGDHYALSLLEHDGLMTPRLVAEFGPMRASQIAGTQLGEIFNRKSVLRTLSGDQKILDACLRISMNALPEGVFELLNTVETPFGQLLNEHFVKVRVIDRNLYTQVDEGTTESRWGRRLTMLRADNLAHLCDVDELLVSGPDLLRLRGDRLDAKSFS